MSLIEIYYGSFDSFILCYLERFFIVLFWLFTINACILICYLEEKNLL